MTNQRKIAGPLMLLAAAMIWGLSFVAQSEGTKFIECFTFNSIRNIVGAFVLLPLILYRKKKNPEPNMSEQERKLKKKTTIKGILTVGIMLTIGLNLQQTAFETVNPGKVGFLTALYMLLVPIFGIFMKKKTSATTWIGVIIGVFGLYTLCIGFSGEAFSLGKGEIITLIGAVAFAFHIISIDYYSDKVDSIVLSCGQFVVAGVLSGILMIFFNHPDIESIMHAIIPLLYTCIFSCGIAFTLQVVGQKYTEPALASMLLCLESVFSVFFEFVILHTHMQVHEYIGCLVMFVGIIIAQLQPKKNSLAQ